jgi:hypothetical protein
MTKCIKIIKMASFLDKNEQFEKSDLLVKYASDLISQRAVKYSQTPIPPPVPPKTPFGVDFSMSDAVGNTSKIIFKTLSPYVGDGFKKLIEPESPHDEYARKLLQTLSINSGKIAPTIERGKEPINRGPSIYSSAPTDIQTGASGETFIGGAPTRNVESMYKFLSDPSALWAFAISTAESMANLLGYANNMEAKGLTGFKNMPFFGSKEKNSEGEIIGTFGKYVLDPLVNK